MHISLSIILLTNSLSATDRKITTIVFSAEELSRSQELMQAAELGYQKQLATILHKHPSLAHYQDVNGNTPLMAAATWGHLEIVAKLIVLGVDIDAQNTNGSSALIASSRRGNAEIVERLITAGANVNTHNQYSATALTITAAGGNTEIVEKLLAAGADINAQDMNGFTALMHATQWGYTETIQILLDARADVTLTSTSEKTALAIAQNMHCIAIVNLLQNHVSIEPEEETLMVKPAVD